MSQVTATLAMTVWIAQSGLWAADEARYWSVGRTVQTAGDSDFDFDSFSEPALQTLFHARAAIGELGGAFVTPEHLLLGLLGATPEAITRFLRRGSSVDALVLQIKERIPASQRPAPEVLIPLSADVSWILRKAIEEADSGLDKSVRVEHILLGLLEQKGETAKALEGYGVRESDIRAYLKSLARDG